MTISKVIPYSVNKDLSGDSEGNQLCSHVCQHLKRLLKKPCSVDSDEAVNTCMYEERNETVLVHCSEGEG